MTSVFRLEQTAHPLVPSGSMGLVICGVVAVPGCLVSGTTLLGPSTVLATVRPWTSRR